MRPVLRAAASAGATAVDAAWRRRGVMALCGLLGAGAGLLVAGQLTHTYQGTASVMVGPPPGAATPTGSQLTVPPAEVVDAAAIVTSPAVRADAAKLAGVRVIAPAVARVGTGSDVVTVAVDATTARTAASWALAYADAYVADQQVATVDALEATAADVAAKVADVGTQIAALDAQIAAAGGPTTTSVPSTASAGTRPLPGVAYNLPPSASSGVAAATPRTVAAPPPSTGNATVDALVARRTLLRDQQAVLQQQATTLRLDAEAFSGGGQVTGGGTPPSSPVSPDSTVWAVVGALVALVG
ncbi:MAG TPA: hypothetical protein VFP61_12740, partial [Acidimicrobiales bacterium]|nr:hypothetical protein [Acidimicrobiales bacterium]